MHVLGTQACKSLPQSRRLVSLHVECLNLSTIWLCAASSDATSNEAEEAEGGREGGKGARRSVTEAGEGEVGAGTKDERGWQRDLPAGPLRSNILLPSE